MITRNEGETVLWKELQFFECAEEWTGREQLEITSDREWTTVVTILERKPCGTEASGKYEDPLEESSKRARTREGR